MTQVYVVTEGKLGAEILKRLLPEDILRNTKFIAGSGIYSAQSLACSILVAKRAPVALVVDADTKDRLTIRERGDFSNELLRRASPGIPFEVLLAIPVIEIVFLQDKSLLERLTHRNFTNLEWELAQFQPKEFLSHVLKEHSTGSNIEVMFSELTEETIDVFQKHPLICELSKFLSSVIQHNERSTDTS